jgi:hypothetical protein
VTAAASAAEHYEAGFCRRLKQAGLRGRPARVSLEGGLLRIVGAKAGAVSTPVGAIERIRIGYHESKVGKAFATRLWVAGADNPLVLQPMNPNEGYADVTRRLAAAVARSRGLRAVESGTSAAAAAYHFVVLTAAFLAFGFVSWLYWDPALWPLLAVFVAFGGLALYALRQMVRTHLPRPVASLSELDRQLPEERTG